MKEEIQIINQNTRREKFKNFIVEKKKFLISIISFLIFLILVFFLYSEFKLRKQIKISNKYNEIIQSYEKNKNIREELVNIIKEKDITYSPLALNFIIDNEIINNKGEVNILFDIVIEDIDLEREIKNLIIYKKALYNSDTYDESDLLKILYPILNSESIWRSHALYLMAEYFISNNERQKSKEFLIKIIDLKDANSKIRTEAQKIINREFSD